MSIGKNESIGADQRARSHARNNGLPAAFIRLHDEYRGAHNTVGVEFYQGGTGYNCRFRCQIILGQTGLERHQGEHTQAEPDQQQGKDKQDCFAAL